MYTCNIQYICYMFIGINNKNKSTEGEISKTTWDDDDEEEEEDEAEMIIFMLLMSMGHPVKIYKKKIQCFDLPFFPRKVDV